MAETLASHTEDQVYVPAPSKCFSLLRRKEVGTMELDMMKLARSGLPKLYNKSICASRGTARLGEKKCKNNDKDSRN